MGKHSTTAAFLDLSYYFGTNTVLSELTENMTQVYTIIPEHSTVGVMCVCVSLWREYALVPVGAGG